MRPGRNAESESGEGFTFERKVSALLYTCLAGEYGIRVVPGTVTKVQLSVSHTGADIDDQLAVLSHEMHSIRHFLQCKRSLHVEAKDEVFGKLIEAFYRTAAGERQPIEQGDTFLIVTEQISDSHKKGLEKLLDIARGHKSMEEFRSVVTKGEGISANGALKAIDGALAERGVAVDPETLLRTLIATRLWLTDVSLDGSHDRRAALNSLAVRTDNGSFEEAEKLYNRFYIAVQDNGRRRAECTFDSLRNQFGGFNRLRPADRTASVFTEEFLAWKDQELTELETSFDAGHAYEAVTSARTVFDQGLLLIGRTDSAGSSKEQYKSRLARALRLIGRGLALMSLTSQAFKWVEQARLYVGYDAKLAGQIAYVALALEDYDLYEEWIDQTLETDRPKIRAAKEIRKCEWQGALDTVNGMVSADLDTRFIRVIALRGLVGSSSEYVNPCINACDELRHNHGDRPVVQFVCAETWLLLDEPGLSSQYTTVSANLDLSFYSQLAEFERNLAEFLDPEAGEFEATSAAMLLIDLQGARMSDQVIFGKRFNEIPTFAFECKSNLAIKIASFYFGIGKKDEAARLMTNLNQNAGNKAPNDDIARMLDAINQEWPSVEHILPDLTGASPQLSASITRGGIYLALKAGVTIPPEWVSRLVSVADVYPFDLEIRALLAFLDSNYDEFCLSFDRLSNTFVQALLCYTALGRACHEDYRRKFVLSLRVTDAAQLLAEDDDLQISPEGLTARNALLSLLKFSAKTFALRPALNRWIETAFNPPDVRELQEIIEVARGFGYEREENLAEALLAYATQRFSDAADFFDKNSFIRHYDSYSIQRLADDSEFRVNRFDRLLGEIPGLLENPDREPGRLTPHVGALRIIGDEKQAYSVAKQNLECFPDDREALQLFYSACVGTSHQTEGLAAAMHYQQLYPNEWVKQLPQDEGLRIFQQQRSDALQIRTAYEACRFLLGQISGTYIESWYGQLGTTCGLQVNRFGLGGRPAEISSLSVEVLIDVGPVLALSKYGLWPSVRGSLRLLIHPGVKQWLQQEVNQLKGDLGEASVTRARQVESMLNHKKLTVRSFSQDEMAAAGENSNLGALELEVCRSTGYQLIDSHAIDGPSCSLGEAIHAAKRAGKLRPITYKRIEQKLRLEDVDINQVPYRSQVVFSSLDLLSIVDADVVDDVLNAFDDILVLPSTTYGLGLQCSNTLYQTKILDSSEEALKDLLDAIDAGDVREITAESHPSLRGSRYPKELAKYVDGRVLWTDDAICRQYVCALSSTCWAASTMEMVDLLAASSKIQRELADDALVRMIADGHRDYTGSRVFQSLYAINISADQPDFIAICQRMGYLLRPEASRFPEEQAFYLQFVRKQLSALAEIVDERDFEYLWSALDQTITFAPEDSGEFLSGLLAELGSLLDGKALWQSAMGLRLNGVKGFVFGDWVNNESNRLSQRQIRRPSDTPVIGLDLLRFERSIEILRRPYQPPR